MTFPEHKTDKRIGLIAGSGQFPILVAREARRLGVGVVALGIRGVTDPEIENFVERTHYFRLGQLEKPLRFLKECGVSRAVMAGKVQHSSLWGGVIPDLRALRLLARLRDKRADTLLSEIAAECSREGIEILSSATYLSHLLVKKGSLTHREPSSKEQADIALGWRVAKTLSGLDIGQTVVLCDGTVAALEAVEGTDACILRAGQILRNASPGANSHKKPGLVVVKVAKPKQDFRFDLPTVGLQTLKTLLEAGVTAMALEAEKTLLFDSEEFVREANRHKIAVVVRE